MWSLSILEFWLVTEHAFTIVWWGLLSLTKTSLFHGLRRVEIWRRIIFSFCRKKVRKGSDLHRELYLTFENRLKKTYGKKKIVGNRWTFSSSFLRSTNHETKSINFSLEFNHLQIKRIFESIFSVWSICVLTVAESIKSPGFPQWSPAYFLL